MEQVEATNRGTKMTAWRQIRSSTRGTTALLLLLFALTVGAQSLSEYQVKAAFLLNFTKFIDWPEAAFENPRTPLSICILGDDPFGRDIDQLVEGEVVRGRRIVLTRLKRPPVPRSCHVLFISKSEKEISALIAGLGPAVLTVSDRDRFLIEGGMIAMFVDDDHVRFDVNQRVALQASLMINARMLNVARQVQK